MQDIIPKLVTTTEPYWDTEAEIARRFFAHATADDHIFYLRAQLWKELNPVDGYFNGLHRELVKAAEMYPRVGTEIDRHDFHFLLLQITEEFNHFVVLADILEHLLGRKLAADDTIQLAEEKKLGDVRRAYADGGNDIDRAAVAFTEGGGAALFRVGAELGGSEINDMTAVAMQVILDDEEDHYLVQAEAAASLIEDEAGLAQMQNALSKISLQRVRMRNEMFRHPMTDEEVDAFIATRAAPSGG